MKKKTENTESGNEKAIVMQPVVVFRVGRYYKHSRGRVIHIVGSAKTTLYGWTLIAEEHGSSDFYPVGQEPDNAVNWEETTEDVWMSGFGT